LKWRVQELDVPGDSAWVRAHGFELTGIEAGTTRTDLRTRSESLSTVTDAPAVARFPLERGELHRNRPRPTLLRRSAFGFVARAASVAGDFGGKLVLAQATPPAVEQYRSGGAVDEAQVVSQKRSLTLTSALR
jgi:hypothetical protein